jgi:hypothetical protein
MREIHTIKIMKIIVYTKRTINELLGKPKNLLPLEVQSVIREGRSKRKFATIAISLTKSLNYWALLNKKIIPIRSMTKWTPSQILSIQCRLFESLNVIIRHHCVQTNVVIPRSLQPNVMHNFGYITSGHVCPHFIVKIL